MKSFFTRLKQKVIGDDIVSQSAALSYYTALALAPIAILLLSFMSALGLKLQEQLSIQLYSLLGMDAARSFEAILEKTQQRPNLAHLASWGSLIVLIISASIVFAQLQSSINKIFEAEYVSPNHETSWQQIRHFIFRRLICIGMVLNFVFISIVSLVISAGLALLENSHLQKMGKIIQVTGNFFVFAILFTAIYHWMPDRKNSWSASWQGGVITALLFVVGKVGIGLYLSKAAIGSAYGAAGSFVVLLVWVYYSSIIFLFGAEISAAMQDHSKLSYENSQIKKAA